MDTNTLNQLSGCQHITRSNPLYTKLENLNEKEWQKLMIELGRRGYNISYNNLDDIFVVY